MNLNKKATSIIESMIVMLVIITGVIGMYSIFDSSTKLSASTKNRIEAIEIAREAIEAMKNIRDTNWMLFGADIDNCWNTLNYNATCVGNTSTTTDITDGSYIIYQDTDNRWKLSGKTTGNFDELTYRNDFRVYKDSNGLYTQTGTLDSTKFNFNPVFTREVKISYPSGNSNNPKMQISSIIQWIDTSSSTPHKIQLDLVLTNWEN